MSTKPQDDREDEQMDFSARSVSERREPTGVPNLDPIVGGGLPRGDLVLVLGLPGSGKTTLASQIMLTAAKAGKTVLILTGLSESASKLIGHLSSYSFFDHTLIGGPVQLLSLQQILPQGLQAVSAAAVAEVRRTKADYVLLDGFHGLRSVDTASLVAQQFLYDVGTALNTLGVTTLITCETDPRDPAFFPEATTADVILGLHYTLLGVRQYRGIEVIKARATAALPGVHALVLDDHGATVYPQLEERIASLPLEPAQPATTTKTATSALTQRTPLERVAFDLPELDAMLRGGIPRATCTLLAGSLGTGKTILALTYALAGIRAEEHVVFLGFRESRAQLRQASEPFAIGTDLAHALEADGRLTFLEVPPIKVNADILADQLLAALDRTGAQRVVIDSVAELERAVLRGADPQRLEDYLGALLHALRRRNVTALLLKETDKVVAATLELSADALSVLAENVLLLQQVPYQGHLHRVLSVLKLRFSDHDTAIREFRIHSPEGIQVLAPFESGTGVLEGITQDQERQALRGSRRRGGEQSPSQERQP
jgi:circadian clock protein KaiC